ncbi:putative uncharacterized protein C3orf49 [Acipenser oxyrinchus oxyrinchus]|uniref:V-SNARE coiled-coil homology domain-containing protein n=1 Tax=Acipenser oxyrinchus oxyrinchus TaxID=40147 RepID=A0AAD8D044_ACIOX|nr:putative uncharacterized protein C3orf49 [Acipenser oxyrinchus oxyrinchus]
MKGKKNKTLEPKGKGIARWHGAVSTDLMKPNVLQPKNELSDESDSECSSIPEGKQDGLGRKVKKTLGKLLSLSHHHQSHEKMKKCQDNTFNRPTTTKHAGFIGKKSFLPKCFKELPSPKLFPKMKPMVDENATIQVDYDVVEAETEKLIGNKLVLRSRRTSRRVSVTSLPIGLQKAQYLKKMQHFGIFKRKKRKPVDKSRKQSVLTLGKLQTQVDDLIETVADRSVKLLAQRHAELEQCEFLGDEILQSSKQFHRITKKRARKYKWKNLCFPCAWCC